MDEEKEYKPNVNARKSDEIRPRVEKTIRQLMDTYYLDGEAAREAFIDYALEESRKWSGAWKGTKLIAEKAVDPEREVRNSIRTSLVHFLDGTTNRRTGNHTNASLEDVRRVWIQAVRRIEAGDPRPGPEELEKPTLFDIPPEKPMSKVAVALEEELPSSVLYRAIVNEDWKTIKGIANDLRAEGK